MVVTSITFVFFWEDNNFMFEIGGIDNNPLYWAILQILN